MCVCVFVYVRVYSLPQWFLSQTQIGDRIGRADHGSKFSVQSPLEPGLTNKEINWKRATKTLISRIFYA